MRPRGRSTQPSSPPYRGAILVAVLVCLTLALLLCGGLARGVVAHQRQLRAEQVQARAFWFTDSATRRAIGQLDSASYTGETWRVEREMDAGRMVGEAKIQVQASDTDPNVLQVSVVARWSEGRATTSMDETRIESREFTVPRTPSGEEKAT